MAGWVDIRRDHGQLIFLDLRDATGLVQMVASPKNEEAHKVADSLRPEWVIRVKGLIKERPAKMVNSEQANGDLEIELAEVEVLNQAETPPFDLSTDGREIKEELRMEYRYLDLRRKRMRENIQTRSRAIRFIREFLAERNFTEIETPILGKSTPEGARDYVVPSRLEQGSFYALPQSPQQYKQLLMVAGLERYFQIARCFRDEDTRGDRQPEFTQLDIEMSFMSRDEIMDLTETLFTQLVETLYPEKHIKQKPWPRLSYQEVLETYGTDRPDLRQDPNDPQELAFGWVIDFPLFEEELEDGHYAPSHHMFTAPNSEDLAQLDSKPEQVRSTQMDMVLNGYEVGGGSVRIHDPEIQRQVFKLIGFSDTQAERFEHMLTAFRYGVPPHGGIASGLDRLLTVLQNEPSIREVIAFPKTGEGRDLLMGAPSEVEQRQLDELGLKIARSKKESGSE